MPPTLQFILLVAGWVNRHQQDVIETLVGGSDAFVLMPTGSGKSTSLAAIIDEANRRRQDHIITIEDPIEYQIKGISQIQVTALDPEPALQQLDLFSAPDPKRLEINRVQDAINTKFGQMQIVPGRLLNRSDMPDVIAPAWKPDGVRQTIE